MQELDQCKEHTSSSEEPRSRFFSHVKKSALGAGAFLGRPAGYTTATRRPVQYTLNKATGISYRLREFLGSRHWSRAIPCVEHEGTTESSAPLAKALQTLDR